MVIKLGQSGLEQDLEQKSLTISSVSLTDNSFIERSADKTLRIDLLPPKRTFTLNYDVISKTGYEQIVSVYDIQSSSLQNLSFILEESTGATTYSVYMPPVSRGEDLRDRPFYKSVQVILEEI